MRCHFLQSSFAPSTPLVQTGYATSALSILETFGLNDLTEKFLAANGVHELTNLLSLDPICHRYFDDLNLWFENTEEVRH